MPVEVLIKKVIFFALAFFSKRFWLSVQHRAVWCNHEIIKGVVVLPVVVRETGN